jgi:DNA mismatch repair ATPase MutS
MGGGLWRGVWYRQYLQDVASGQARVHSLLAAAGELGRRLSAADAAVLQDLGARIAALLSRPAALELTRLATSSTSAARLAFDQLARDGAKPLLSDVVECLGTLEAMWSLAVATVEHAWSYPRPSSHFSVQGLFHPFLGDKAVPNDLRLDDRVRVCFITGPNMAGKSTFLKAIALAILLGHAGCGVPAASLEFPVVGTVFSSVQIADSLSAGESFYLAEVRRIRALAVALHEHKSAVAVVDEPFRGTNVHDAAEATLAVITRLADHPASVVFVASHIGEVVPSIIDDSRICLLHFAADITADQPRFDYRLRAGVSAQRLGMTLLKQERVLELLERSVRS